MYPSELNLEKATASSTSDPHVRSLRCKLAGGPAGLAFWQFSIVIGQHELLPSIRHISQPKASDLGFRGSRGYDVDKAISRTITVVKISRSLDGQ
jgi:hypothetical protein